MGAIVFTQSQDLMVPVHFALLVGLCSAIVTTVDYHCVLDSSSFASREDLRQIQGCRSLRGDLNISNFVDSSVSLDNLEYIHGNLILANSTALKAFFAPRLHTVSYSFRVDHLAALTTIEVPLLRELNSLEWTVAPRLSEVVWRNLKDVNNITIVDTSVKHLVNFSSPQVLYFNVNNNRYLQYVAFNFKEVTHSFQLTGNARNLEGGFSQLKVANNLTVSDVSNLSMDSLRVVSGSMNLLTNRFSYVQFPSLTKVGESLRISGNTRVERADFSAVTEIGGGLVVTNNTALRKVDFFPGLQVIEGALEIEGKIQSTEWKKLSLVKGSIKIYSSDQSFDCLSEHAEKLQEALQGGEFDCRHFNKAGHLVGSSFLVSGTIQHVVCVVVLAACFAMSMFL